MSPDIINNIQRYQYNAHNGNDLLSQVDKVICLISQNSFISAGLHPSGAVLTVHCSSLTTANWQCSFIEHEFMNDPLLAEPSLIKQIFVAADKHIVIPNSLLEQTEIATAWLQKIYFCEANERSSIAYCTQSAETIAYAYPKEIDTLCARYTSNIPILPISLIQLQYGATAESLLQCTISDHTAFACIHSNQKLQWHQSFNFENAADVIYQLAAACQQLNLDIQTLPLHIIATSPNQITRDLAHYLPNMSEQQANMASHAAAEWASTILLFQQLNTCA